MATTEERLSSLETKFEVFMQEMRDFKAEIRDRDNQRATEIMEMRQRQDAAQTKHDSDMKELRADIKSTLKHIQGLTIAAMVGIGAIAVGVLGFLWSTARNM